MTETTIPNRTYTFEDVWAALMEDRVRQEKAWERQDKAWEQQRKDWEQREKAWEQQRKETDRRLGDLSNRFGEMVEHLVAPSITERFNELGFHFNRIAEGNVKILDDQGKIRTEVDLLLENGEYIVAVEVKAKPLVNDVKEHVRRLEILREDWLRHKDKRKILGAMAGAVFMKAAKQAAIKAGFYVLDQSGDTMKMDIPDGFVPRAW